MDPGQQGLKTTELDFIARGQEFEMSGYDYTPDLHNLFKTEDGHEDQIRALEAENQVGYVWNQKVVSLDCEMVQTGETNTDLSLARVTILDQDGQTIFDELCKPGKPVVDYLTQYSGITEGMLDDQQSIDELLLKVRKILGIQTESSVERWPIICGHGLDNDLRYLNMKCPFIIDTALWLR